MTSTEIGSDTRARVESNARGRDAQTLLDIAFKNLYGDDYVQTLWLKTRGRSGQEMARKLQITRKQSKRPGKALIRFLQPFAVRRTSILVQENDGASDDHFVYLPTSKRTMHLAATQRADSFFGTDLAYEDLEPKNADDFTAVFVEGTRADSADCLLMEIEPRPHFESSYDKMVSCVEPRRGIVVSTDFYRRGKLWKRLEIDLAEVRAVQDRFIPFRMTISTPRRSSQTVVLTESYELRPDIPDKLFSLWNLEAGDADHDRNRAGPIGESRHAEIDPRD